MPRNALYTSPIIQNEIIEILVDLVRQQIVVDTLPKIRPGTNILFDGEEVVLAKEILNTILSKDFVFLLNFMDDFLALLTPAYKMLQSREMGYREAMPVLQTTMKSIEALNMMTCWRKCMQQPSSLSASPDRERRSSKLGGFAVVETIGERGEMDFHGHIKSCFFEVIDVTVRKFNTRVNENSDLLITLSSVAELHSEKLAPLKELLGIVIPNDLELVIAKANMDLKRDII